MDYLKEPSLCLYRILRFDLEVISKSSWLTVCVEDKEKTADLFVSVPCLCTLAMTVDS